MFYKNYYYLLKNSDIDTDYIIINIIIFLHNCKIIYISLEYVQLYAFYNIVKIFIIF